MAANQILRIRSKGETPAARLKQVDLMAGIRQPA
ncbi:msl9397 (plasmid) [Mesorhizobium japonicum MAFF 303099]|uniref:Msl9397 protein n=1 Tax=Mesorhizobium japonicum (strain LMG 29417 / CECT 9101 / MAFF 303099) TaxID=266835 RepID=Q982H1_RHILO|nr:msl9397 [Mesorhizobium japonicum MAFF 303099]